MSEVKSRRSKGQGVHVRDDEETRRKSFDFKRSDNEDYLESRLVS